MLNNYLIDILIMMLNIIASYNKLLYAIVNTLSKITTHLRSTFQKLTILKFKVFKCTENFVRWVTILSHSAENFAGHAPCIPNFLNFAAVCLFKIIFCEYFGLW